MDTQIITCIGVVLSPNGGGEPFGKLAKHVKQTFGSCDKMKKLISQAAISQFGSDGIFCFNENKVRGDEYIKPKLTFEYRKTPLLLIDVWEHAYYLKYQNR
ncbi:MAG: Fe-Mn family superoxide dismutase [Turicibacter sp.]